LATRLKGEYVKKIASDSTIATVWPHLTHQQNYVGHVYQKLKNCAAEHGNAHVRIGVTGSGQKPCFRIFRFEGDEEVIVGSFWDSQDPLEKEDALNTNWSSASMSFEEVEVFFTNARK